MLFWAMQWGDRDKVREVNFSRNNIIQYNNTIIRDISKTLHIKCTTTLSTQETLTIIVTVLLHTV